MSREEILGLFSDVASLLSGLQSELSCITTSDTGNDPTWRIQDGIKELHAKIADYSEPIQQEQGAQPSEPPPETGSTPKEKGLS